MNTLLFIFLIVSFVCIFFLFRNNYTWMRGKDARKVVTNWCNDLIKINQYMMGINYYEEMIIDYDTYLFNIFKWGKYSRIKPEYQSLVEDYGENNE